MVLGRPLHRYTHAEYVALEREGPTNHELLDGEISLRTHDAGFTSCHFFLTRLAKRCRESRGTHPAAVDVQLQAAQRELERYIESQGLNRLVSLRADDSLLKLVVIREGHDLWLGHAQGRGYFMVADRDDKPTGYFDVGAKQLVALLPPSVLAEVEAAGRVVTESEARPSAENASEASPEAEAEAAPLGAVGAMAEPGRAGLAKPQGGAAVPESSEPSAKAVAPAQQEAESTPTGQGRRLPTPVLVGAFILAIGALVAAVGFAVGQ